MQFLSLLVTSFVVLVFFSVESRGEPSLEYQNVRADILETSIEKTKASLLQQNVLKRLVEIGDFDAAQKEKLSKIFNANNNLSATINELRSFILNNPNLTQNQKNKMSEVIENTINSPIP